MQLSKPQKLILQMQFRNVGVSKNGRRFTNDEKILALSLSKKSPAAYTHLSSLFTLPSRSVLQSYLSSVPLDVGVNSAMVEHLSDLSCNYDTKKKQFFVCWDEVHLHPHLSYDRKKDKIIGFEDFGTRRTSNFADHALVFMLRRISDGVKLPFSYYFCNAQTKYGQLIECIKSNLRAAKLAGLSIAVTICDQGSSKVRAIKELRSEYVKAYMA